MQQRRIDQRRDDEHVHRAIGRKAGSADPVGDPHPPIDLHGARVATLHLRQELRSILLLDQRAADAALSERDRERQPDRPGSDDENLLCPSCGIGSPSRFGDDAGFGYDLPPFDDIVGDEIAEMVRAAARRGQPLL